MAEGSLHSLHSPRSLQRVACAALVAASFTPACSGDGKGPWEAVSRSSSRLTVCAKGPTLRGIDVSEYQGEVDWQAVAASGVSFAMARVSNGAETLDLEFRANWSGIKEAGMVRGVYQFFRGSEDPVDQANLLVQQVGALEPGDLSPVADVEFMDGESGATLVARLAAWVARVHALTGRTPILYASPGFWDDLPDTGQFSSLGPWVADWGPACPDTPVPWTNWQFWQYADDGNVPGIRGAVDLDSFNGTLLELQETAAPAPKAAGSAEGGSNRGREAPQDGEPGANPGGGLEDASAATFDAGPGCDCHSAEKGSRRGGGAPSFVALVGAAVLRRRRPTPSRSCRASVRKPSERAPPPRSRSISRTVRA